MSATDHTHDPDRRDFLYVATGMAAVVGAGAVVWPFIDQMRPDASTLAHILKRLTLLRDNGDIKPDHRGEHEGNR